VHDSGPQGVAMEELSLPFHAGVDRRPPTSRLSPPARTAALLHVPDSTYVPLHQVRPVGAGRRNPRAPP
jgi:hypothetical protein